MSEITLGIIGGGQLGSMLAIAAKKLNIKTIIFCDDKKIIGDEFYVMEKVNGTIFRGSQPKSELPKSDLIPGLVSSFVNTLSEIHSLKTTEIGLQDFGKPKGYVDRQVNGWIKRYNKLVR